VDFQTLDRWDDADRTPLSDEERFNVLAKVARYRGLVFSRIGVAVGKDDSGSPIKEFLRRNDQKSTPAASTKRT
jgi:hypothetical protein